MHFDSGRGFAGDAADAESDELIERWMGIVETVHGNALPVARIIPQARLSARMKKGRPRTTRSEGVFRGARSQCLSSMAREALPTTPELHQGARHANAEQDDAGRAALRYRAFAPTGPCDHAQTTQPQ